MCAWNPISITAIGPPTAAPRTTAADWNIVSYAGARRESRRWCASCADSIVWEARQNCITRWRERPLLVVVFVVCRLLFQLYHFAESAQIRLLRRPGRLAQLAAVVGVVALLGAERVRAHGFVRSGGVLRQRQGRVLEPLHSLGRNLAAECARGNRPFPDRVAAVVEIYAAGTRRLGLGIGRAGFPRGTRGGRGL